MKKTKKKTKKRVKASRKKKVTKKRVKKTATKRQRKLTAKQKRFVDEYFACGMNAKKAAILAGYSEKTAKVIGAENLTKPNLAELISKRQEAAAEKLQCSADDIAQELHKLGFSNMANYMRVGKDGDPYLDFSALTREQAAALAEVTVDDYLEGRGEDARTIRRVKFKLVDKRASLVDLAKLLGHMPTRHEHTGKGGGPIDQQITFYLPENQRRADAGDS